MAGSDNEGPMVKGLTNRVWRIAATGAVGDGDLIGQPFKAAADPSKVQSASSWTEAFKSGILRAGLTLPGERRRWVRHELTKADWPRRWRWTAFDRLGHFSRRGCAAGPSTVDRVCNCTTGRHLIHHLIGSLRPGKFLDRGAKLSPSILRAGLTFEHLSHGEKVIGLGSGPARPGATTSRMATVPSSRGSFRQGSRRETTCWA